MQKRHIERCQYFHELAYTCEKYLIPYISKRLDLSKHLSILEIGCGDGGNLLPFARMGHHVVGIDISPTRIEGAISFFERENAHAEFICGDILEFTGIQGCFDLIICHDVIEHIGNKQLLLARIEFLLKPSGLLYMAFPAWQMPFGGHHQICRNPILSKLPYIHLLPESLYRNLLTIARENHDCIKELLSIKSTSITIEHFEKLISGTSLHITDRCLYLINPHYQAKFGLAPRKLPALFARIPYLRNFLTTSCFYLIQPR